MSKCGVCGTEQVKIGESQVIICGHETTVNHYNINLITYMQGNWICDDCMETYYKIRAMASGINYSYMGKKYYSDGRNLASKK